MRKDGETKIEIRKRTLINRRGEQYQRGYTLTINGMEEHVGDYTALARRLGIARTAISRFVRRGNRIEDLPEHLGDIKLAAKLYTRKSGHTYRRKPPKTTRRKVVGVNQVTGEPVVTTEHSEKYRIIITADPNQYGRRRQPSQEAQKVGELRRRVDDVLERRREREKLSEVWEL